MNEWSETLKKDSIDVLESGRCMEPCRVKKWNDAKPNTSLKFGTVSVVKGISQGIWEVVLENSEEIEEFNSVQDLVASGWVVD